MIRGLSKRAVIRFGYGAVITILFLSAIEAYRIQLSVSEEHVDIYRHYVEQDRAISVLRRNLWQVGNEVRDFFISTTPEQAAVLRSQVEELKREDENALAQLARATQGTDIVPKLRKSLDEFWSIIAPIPDTMLHLSDQEHFAFLQREIVPRRGELYNALIGFSSADQERLEENEREFAAARRRASERLVLMLGVGLMLCLVVARFTIRHAENMENRAERHYTEVEHAKRELQELSMRLLEIEEEGKRRLSRELHDEIGQTLALLQIEISHAQSACPPQSAAVRERLQRARELAEKTVQTIRNISALLRPALLDDLGLVPALQYQLEDFQRRSGIACEFVEEHVAEQLPDAFKTCVYRCVQEALHNAEKHSAASRVRIAVRQFPDILTVEIEDDGQGFQVNEQGMPMRRNGLGLLGMRERVSGVGGSLTILSAPGRGTRITMRIPLPAGVQGEPKIGKEVNV